MFTGESESTAGERGKVVVAHVTLWSFLSSPSLLPAWPSSPAIPLPFSPDEVFLHGQKEERVKESVEN